MVGTDASSKYRAISGYARMSVEASWPVLSGCLCYLRVLTVADAETWHAGEDVEQRRWFEFPGPAPFENVVKAITNWRDSWKIEGPVRQWGIWTVSDDSLAGGVELSNRGDGRANLSYVVFPNFRRRGLATEAIALASEWAFQAWNIDAVIACVDEQNVASRELRPGTWFLIPHLLCVAS